MKDHSSPNVILREAFGQPMSTASDRLLTGSYSLVKRSGFLETSVGSHLFTSAYFLYKRYIEDNFLAFVRSHTNLLRGGNVLDIGANLGYTAQILARATEPGQRVYAFEPEPFNYGILQRIADRPKFNGKIVATQCAVGAEEGMVRLWLNMHCHADHRVITDRFRPSDSALHAVSVPMVTIDGFLERNPQPVSFVKIDVQGFELPVCQGMSATIERNPGITIFLEYAPFVMRELGFDPSQLVRFLTGRGFECFLVGSHGRLSPGLPPEIADRSYVDLLFSRGPIARGPNA